MKWVPLATIGVLCVSTTLFGFASAAWHCNAVGVGYECAGVFGDAPGHEGETCTVTWSDSEADGDWTDDGTESVHSFDCVPDVGAP